MSYEEYFQGLILCEGRQREMLIKGKPLEYAGKLYSEEYKRKFLTEKVGFQVVKGPYGRNKITPLYQQKTDCRAI